MRLRASEKKQKKDESYRFGNRAKEGGSLSGLHPLLLNLYVKMFLVTDSVTLCMTISI